MNNLVFKISLVLSAYPLDCHNLHVMFLMLQNSHGHQDKWHAFTGVEFQKFLYNLIIDLFKQDLLKS